METIAFVISAGIALFGLYALISPRSVDQFAVSFRSRRGILFAAGLRLVYGAALYLTGAAKTPPDQILRGVGVFVFVAGLVTLTFTPARMTALIDWWVGTGKPLKRAWGLAAAAIGICLATLVRA